MMSSRMITELGSIAKFELVLRKFREMIDTDNSIPPELRDSLHTTLDQHLLSARKRPLLTTGGQERRLRSPIKQSPHRKPTESNTSPEVGYELPTSLSTNKIKSIDPIEFRQAMGNLASGVAIVAVGTALGRRGLTVGSVTSICMEPPCLLVGINASSETHDAILANGRFGVSLLGGDQRDIALRFAGRDGANGVDRFDTAAWDQGVLDVPILQSAVCVLECVLHRHQVVGTHGIFMGRIVATRPGQGTPLINFRRQLRTLPHG
ncbi:flavin reductase family protein [Bradyrhizobium sp. CB3481]|uniref:flavin reductase family protein n=1 Tax=Bradyrhizobium sp. CB3481 TaxID=3039158 RepID=UPI0024B17213|nr:flavin reductase family protein [Bradyrhizobium sp. CB3481]WFU14482.1 flavin reductase family protein [Bradyrhizobium sp. CB3481]